MNNLNELFLDEPLDCLGVKPKQAFEFAPELRDAIGKAWAATYSFLFDKN